MDKRQEFIDFVEKIINTTPNLKMPDGARVYFEALKNDKNSSKPMFTENGKLILRFLKDNLDTELWKAKDIAERLFISSRTASGAMWKLVSDGFVEKIGTNPVIYTITQKGKEIEID